MLLFCVVSCILLYTCLIGEDVHTAPWCIRATSWVTYTPWSQHFLNMFWTNLNKSKGRELVWAEHVNEHQTENVQLRINTWLLKNQWMNVLDIDSIANPTTRVGTLHILLYQISSKKNITYACRSLMLYQCIVFARSLPDHSMHHMSLHESFFLYIIV